MQDTDIASLIVNCYTVVFKSCDSCSFLCTRICILVIIVIVNFSQLLQYYLLYRIVKISIYSCFLYSHFFSLMLCWRIFYIRPKICVILVYLEINSDSTLFFKGGGWFQICSYFSVQKVILSYRRQSAN